MQQNNKTPLLSICCLAYNHAPYIRQCLDGFMMQKTDFAFEVLIHDDASTDGTADIIREYEAKYPDIIKPIYQTENQYSKGIKISGTYQFPRAKGKYIAMCEGDDYWTDPLKLQKQVDFLEKNEDYVLCCHRIDLLFGTQIIAKDTYNQMDLRGDITFTNRENLDYWMTETSSVVFRFDMFDSDFSKKYKYARDAHMIYHLLRRGKGMYMDFLGGVYRKHEGGIYSSMNNLQQIRTAYLIYKELQQNNLDDSVIQEFFLKYRQQVFNELRLMAFKRDFSNGFLKTVSIYVSDEQEIKWRLKCYQKILKSFVKGFLNNKNRI